MIDNFKVVMLGDASVGKTTLVARWIFNEFKCDTKPTLGTAYQEKKVPYTNGKHYKINIWDTAGQEEYFSFTSVYCRDAKGAMIVFDLTKFSTFENVKKWVSIIRDNGDVPIVLCGNKSDLDTERAVSSEVAYELAQSFNATYFETSAITSHNVQEAFTELSHSIIKKIEQKVVKEVKYVEQRPDPPIVNIKKTKRTKRGHKTCNH